MWMHERALKFEVNMTIRKLETMSDWLSVSTDMKINELMHYLNTLKSQLENMAECTEPFTLMLYSIDG